MRENLLEKKNNIVQELHIWVKELRYYNEDSGITDALNIENVTSLPLFLLTGLENHLSI